MSVNDGEVSVVDVDGVQYPQSTTVTHKYQPSMSVKHGGGNLRVSPVDVVYESIIFELSTEFVNTCEHTANTIIVKASRIFLL